MEWKAALGAARLVSAGIAAGLIAAHARPAAAQAESPIDYDLPSQELGQTLRDIARLSGHEILFVPEIVRGRKAPAVRGRFGFDGAVRSALAGSALIIEYRAGAALVREPASGSSDAPPSSPDETGISVTGTRIRGAGSASPVTVVTRRALEQAGINDLAGLTRILPQNYSGGQNRGIAGGGEQGGQQNLNNSATLNLRGLGPDATLTLLDGHRLAYDSINQGIDISAIPLSAIERVEVVGDGSSALYGSDAVGGVANIILRRDFSGAQSTARLGASTRGGDFQQQYSLVAGRRWTGGGFMIALDHDSASPIYAGQRAFARTVDPSLTLTDGNRQTSAVMTAHQQLSPWLSLEVDGYAMDRRSLLQNPFLPTADVHVSGLVSRPHVRSYALSPTLRATIGQWQASLSPTLADSRTLLDTNNYSNRVPRHSHLLYEDRLKGLEATAEGPLLALPGGEARLAFGGGLRGISLHDRFLNLTSGQPVTVRNFTESRNVQFAYGELSLPLAGPDLGLPLLERLSLSAALRFEHWDRIASVTTPKLGLIYQPAPGVTFRGTWGRSFKIPTLLQVNQIEEGDLIPGFFFSPRPQPAGSPVLLLTGSSPGLKPERATSWSGTVELTPRQAPGLELRATYFHVDYRGRIASPLTSVLTALFNPLFNDLIVYNPSAAQVNALIATLPGGLVNQTGLPFDPSGVGAIVDVAIRNTERQEIQGVDLNGDYRADLGNAGTLLLTAAASYLRSNQQLAPGQPIIELAGTVFHPPHWRGRAGATWEAKDGNLSMFATYVGPTTDNRFAQPARIDPFVTLDLTASLRTRQDGPLGNVEVTASVLNLLDQKPHFISNAFPEAAPYDSTNESPVGRFVGLSVRKIW